MVEEPGATVGSPSSVGRSVSVQAYAPFEMFATARAFETRGIVESQACKHDPSPGGSRWPHRTTVTSSEPEGWLGRQGSRRQASVGHAPTQAQAEKRAKEIVSNQGGGEVRIHGTDGRIQTPTPSPPAETRTRPTTGGTDGTEAEGERCHPFPHTRPHDEVRDQRRLESWRWPSSTRVASRSEMRATRSRARIVTALGQTWHDRRVDHGIDGEIELINPATRQPLNRLVLVQSKASNSPFPGETDAGFHFLISNDDIAYWTNGTNPVIVVCSHPLADRSGGRPPRASPPGPGGKSWKIEFDKSADRLDRERVPALLHSDRRWETRPSPVSIHRSERLVTNLLALVETPSSIYVAPTWLTDARHSAQLRKRGYHRSDWLLRDRTIFSFTDPKSSALGSFVEGGIETIDV